uniref:Protein kinase domain-containing protein n=1 Tax=Sparus aurata TaxID=8175 RepID=A0A671YPN8_SPAAU
MDLEEAVQRCQPSRDALEYKDTMAFLSLLKSCLHLDPSKRITPKEALKHPFITMTHLLNGKETPSYVVEAHQFMVVCPTYYPDEEDEDWTGPQNAYNIEAGNINQSRTFQVQKNDVLFSNSTHYLVMNFNGEGAFGKVAQCLNLSTNERVALKIHTQNEEHVIQQEVYMLEAIRALDPEKNNIVRFVESFRFNGLSCLAFEMLDKSLWDLMKESWTPLRLNEIRPVIHQLLVAFDALNSIGGAFGKVAQCLNLSTNERVALKIHTQNEEHVIQREVYMLEAIRALDPEKNNIVRFVESFRFNGLSCLAFEMLDRSLWDLMKESWTPLRLNEIRPVIHQLLVAFDALKGIGVIHTDLKPDNIMLVNHKDQPYRVKLIDFGLAAPVNMLEAGDTVQPIGYRAPEVMLGLPLSEAIDMWGVGCVMAFLCFGRNLFPGDCQYHCMATIVQMLGQPEDHLLSAGIQKEYKKTTDSIAFVSLLKSCLDLDPSKRITPKEALKHPFITMAHLVNEKDTHAYACEAHQLMAVLGQHCGSVVSTVAEQMPCCSGFSPGAPVSPTSNRKKKNECLNIQ